MISEAFRLTKPQIGTVGIVAIGVSVGLATVLGLSIIAPVKIVFLFGGLALILPGLVVREPKAYGLFLLVFSIPIDFIMRTTKWLVHPAVLAQAYSLPPSGTLSVDLYVTDVLLFALMVPWLLQLWRRQCILYFPKTGYLFILYLAWALIVSLLVAKSFYLSIFEWIRQTLYFMFFLYLANNVVSRAQFRAIVLGLFAALVVEAVVVIAFFSLGVGTENHFFPELLYGRDPNEVVEGTLKVAETGYWSHVKRSAGTFTHPAHAAYYFEYILPIVLGYIMTARRARGQILHGTIYAITCIALVLTFSRAGIGGFLVSFVIFFLIATWSRLISHRIFVAFVFLGVMSAALTIPMLISYMDLRPAATETRWQIIQPSINAILKRPIWGAGLNNSSAATEGSLAVIQTDKGSAWQVVVVHNYYLIVLVDLGIVGFLLLFGFLGFTVATALRHMRSVEIEKRILLIGIVSSLGGIAIHNFADPFGGHAVQTMMWLHAGLVFAIARQVQAPSLRTVRNTVPFHPARLPAAAVGAMRSPS